LERLFQYLLRPPLAHDRLELMDSDRVRLRLKRPWRNGATHLELDPLSFLGRLVTLVPPPGMHQVRFHGALGARSKVRRAIIPSRPASPRPLVQLGLFAGDRAHDRARQTDGPAPPQALPTPVLEPPTDGSPESETIARPQSEAPKRLPKLQRMTWARLLKRMAGFDMETCPRCDRPLRLLEIVLEPDAIAATLTASQRGYRRVGLTSISARGPPEGQLALPFGRAASSDEPTVAA
jgi:hypothetical protein